MLRAGPAKIVLVNLDGLVLDGDFKPSSDTKTHLKLYQSFADIGDVAHSHSPFAWAQAMREIPILGTTHADYTVRNILCTSTMSDAEIAEDYEEATGSQIVERLEGISPQEIEMILVACHGPFSWGKNAIKALENAVVLEEIAKMAFYTMQLNAQVLPLKDSLKAKHYYRKHGEKTYYGQ